jgi:8-oxo-dGTP diphosphatase
MTSRIEAQTLPVTTDVVIFTISDQRLKLLFIADGDGASERWTFPGGPVGVDEDLDACAMRTLAARTGIEGVYLEQLYTFGRVGGGSPARGITVAYYALVPMDKLRRQVGADGQLRWFPLEALPVLTPETERMVTMAHERLAAKLDYSTIAFQFMPERFTLSELQTVYETILREKLDKRNFRKQVMNLDRIEETGELSRRGSHRPARLYRLKYPNRVEIIK